MARDDERRELRRGFACAVAAQLIWGVQPLFLPLLDAMTAAEILAHRVLWSWAVAMAVVAARRRTRQGFKELARNKHAVRTLAAGSALMGCAWGLYIYGVVTGRIVETSLALFIGPIVTAVLGVGALRERLRPYQWLAVAVSTAGVLVLGWGYGGVPWVALLIAGTVALYGLIKKRLAVPAVEGMAVETVFLVPVAIGILVWLGATNSLVFPGTWHLAPLVPVTGIVSTLPLLFFSASVNRVPLSTFGLLMYLNPVIQFAIGAWVFGESVTAARWFGFALLWIALAVFAAGALRATRPASGTAQVSPDASTPAWSSDQWSSRRGSGR
ncbi:EamA family transporter RarD [Yinghuangia sp. YIM S09857]|uniref:EamA family transporter RarD n=1 Tax=Yinghuangia sp. YIM S09857 TaxID=3436929 RepID=UPI003F53A960